VQLEPDKLIDVCAEFGSLAGNKIGIVWHCGVFDIAMFRRSTFVNAVNSLAFIDLPKLPP
jgi:hypothetical protein